MDLFELNNFTENYSAIQLSEFLRKVSSPPVKTIITA